MSATLVDRLRGVDPVLRVLSTSTLISTLGRGVFLTLTVLYLNFVVHLPAAQIAIVLGAASVTGIVFSLIGGQLSDLLSARRLLLGAVIAEAAGLVWYAMVGSFWLAIVVACVTGAAEAVGHSARAAIIARAFTGSQRVRTRAVLRTLTNIGIAIGSGVSGITLAVGTPFAFRASLVTAGVVYLVGQLNLVRLPASVDAPGTSRNSDADETARDGDDPLIDETALAAEQLPGDELPTGKASRPGVSPWRNPRYLLFALLTGLFAVQFSLEEVGVPLWVAHDTTAPKSILSVLLIVNTAIVIAFTVRLSRNTHRLRIAGWASAISGVLIAAACVVYALAQGLPVIAACVVLVLGAATGAFAEVLSQASVWGLSFELADPARAGAYQGVVGTTFSIGAAVGPVLVASTALALGLVGWIILAAILLAAALGTTWIAFRAARQQPELA
jgi:MFS family permease